MPKSKRLELDETRCTVSGTAVVYHSKRYQPLRVAPADFELRFGRESNPDHYRAFQLRKNGDVPLADNGLDSGIALIVGPNISDEYVKKALMRIVKAISSEGLAIGRLEKTKNSCARSLVTAGYNERRHRGKNGHEVSVVTRVRNLRSTETFGPQVGLGPAKGLDSFRAFLNQPRLTPMRTAMSRSSIGQSEQVKLCRLVGVSGVRRRSLPKP